MVSAVSRRTICIGTPREAPFLFWTSVMPNRESPGCAAIMRIADEGQASSSFLTLPPLSRVLSAVGETEQPCGCVATSTSRPSIAHDMQGVLRRQ